MNVKSLVRVSDPNDIKNKNTKNERPWSFTFSLFHVLFSFSCLTFPKPSPHSIAFNNFLFLFSFFFSFFFFFPVFGGKQKGKTHTLKIVTNDMSTFWVRRQRNSFENESFPKSHRPIGQTAKSFNLVVSITWKCTFFSHSNNPFPQQENSSCSCQFLHGHSYWLFIIFLTLSNTKGTSHAFDEQLKQKIWALAGQLWLPARRKLTT